MSIWFVVCGLWFMFKGINKGDLEITRLFADNHYNPAGAERLGDYVNATRHTLTWFALAGSSLASVADCLFAAAARL